MYQLKTIETKRKFEAQQALRNTCDYRYNCLTTGKTTINVEHNGFKTNLEPSEGNYQTTIVD